MGCVAQNSDNQGVTPLPPCHRTPNPHFIKPIPGRPGFQDALDLCHACPLIVSCAANALTAGNTTDGCVTAPASDVIQAGVHCTGDHMTAWRLSRIAGVPMPELRDTSTRNTPAPFCRACKRVMVSWTRTPEDMPEGAVMHHGRGYCTECRTHYRASLKADEGRKNSSSSLYDAGRVRSPLQRLHRTPTAPRTEQLSLL